MIINETNIFNRNIPIRGYDCNTDGNCDVDSPIKKILGGKIEFGVNLYIYIQSICNAKCEFCNIHSEMGSPTFDYDTLERVLEELKNKILVTRIGITGGEPFLDTLRLDKVIKIVRKYFPNVDITVHTNGSFFNKIDKVESLDQLNEIHLSRHHYSDILNNKIFGLGTLRSYEIENLSDSLKSKLYLNCCLVKGFIDSENEIINYLEWALERNIKNVAFIDLTNINDFCKNHFVDLFKFDLMGLFKTGIPLKNIDICSCTLGTYTSKKSLKTAKVYFRQTKSWPTKCFHYLEFKNNKLFAGENEIPILY